MELEENMTIAVQPTSFPPAGRRVSRRERYEPASGSGRRRRPGRACRALALAKQGVPVLVLEAEPALTPGPARRHLPSAVARDAGALGVTDEMQQIGIKVPRWQIRDREEGVIVEWDLGLIADLTPYPYRLHLEQHRLTPILFDKLQGLPRTPRCASRRSFTGVTQDADG